ncbi:hypothetical protein BJ138DRAFT_1014545, partial [Hygrophoropsis aurantiaca]
MPPAGTEPQDRPPYYYLDTPFCEPVNSYRRGGFHPVHIHDILHERYEVVIKLGYGSFATVWLVKDLRAGRYASLKIL